MIIKRMILSLMAMVGVLTLSAQEIYDFKVMNDEGQEVSLSDYKGKVLLIVNTATRCGESSERLQRLRSQRQDGQVHGRDAS